MINEDQSSEFAEAAEGETIIEYMVKASGDPSDKDLDKKDGWIASVYGYDSTHSNEKFTE